MTNFYKKFKTKLAGDQDLTEIVKGSSTSFVMKIIGLGCTQLFVLLVARFLGAETWGIFSLALSVITIGSIFSTLGLDIGLLKQVAGSEDKSNIAKLYRKSLMLTCFTSLLFTALVYYNADHIAIDFFNKPDLEESFRIAAFAILPFTLMKLNSQTLRGLKKITKHVFLNFVARYLFGSVLLMFFLMFLSGNNIVLYAFISALYIIVILSSVWLYKEKLIKGRSFLIFQSSNSDFLKLLKLSFPLLLASSLAFVKGWVDTIMVGFFMTEADVGIYNIALKLSGVIAIVLASVNTIAAPKFAEAYSEKNFEKLQENVQQATKMIFYCSMPILFVFLLFPEFILKIFGTEFIDGKQAFILLCIGKFIGAISGSVGHFLQMTGSQVAFQNITLGFALLGIGLNYLLIPIFGIEGAALSTCAGLVFWNLSCVIFIRHKYNIKTYFNPLQRVLNKD